MHGRRRPRRLLAAFLTLGGLTGASCARAGVVAADVVVEWTMTPSAPIVGGEAVAEFTLLDPARRPIPGARIHVEARMSHPGMATLVWPALEHGLGTYVSRVTLSMAGDWVLFVAGELPDGRHLRQRVASAIARPSGG